MQLPHINTFVAFAAGLALLALVLGARKVWLRIRALVATKFGRAPFESRAVMNKGELAMYRRLLQALPAGCLVLPQVQMSGFMGVRGLVNKDERWKYLNRIIKLSLDFLVVDAASAMPLAGIEVDGPTHRGGKAFMSGQKDADARKSQAMKSAGIPLLRITTTSTVTPSELREWLTRSLGRR